MIFKDILNHFDIEGEFPQYLLNQTFNDVFVDGDLTEVDSGYKIAVTTRQNVTHNMIIAPGSDFPVTVMSELPSGLLNGMKFGRTEGDVTYISEY